jgi:hypothetical protein
MHIPVPAWLKLPKQNSERLARLEKELAEGRARQQLLLEALAAGQRRDDAPPVPQALADAARTVTARPKEVTLGAGLAAIVSEDGGDAEAIWTALQKFAPSLRDAG